MRNIVAILVAFFPFLVSGQQPFLRDINLSESASGINVHAAGRDRSGYLWLATEDGLSCFNGRNVRSIPDSIHSSVTAVAVHGSDVWIGCKNGSVGYLADGIVRKLDVADGPQNMITSLQVLAGGVLIAGTEDQGIYVIINGRAIHINSAKGLSDNSVYSIAVAGGKMLVNTDMGINVLRMQHGKIAIEVNTTKQGLTDDIVTVARHRAGNEYWVGTQQGGVVLYDLRRRMALRTFTAGGWPYGQVSDILPVTHNRIWVATTTGYLVRITSTDSGGLNVQPYYYAGKVFNSLLRDDAGNVWCTSNKGISLMTGEYLEHIAVSQPYSLSDVTAMAWGNDGLWLGMKKKLYFLRSSDSTNTLKYVLEVKANITSLYEDHNHTLWVGTFGDGIYHSAGSGFTKVTGLDEPSSDASILSIAGVNGHLWVAGLKGVDELVQDGPGRISRLRHYGKRDGIGSDYVYQLYPDNKGNMWMATDGAGVCMYDGKNYHHWDSSFGSDSKVAYSITQDEYGNIWAGTMYKDLYYYHNNNWQNLRRQETQYPDLNIAAVMANATGQVVSVYQRCVDEWYPRSNYFRHYNSAMGLGIDSTSAALNCLARDDKGNIYVPYQHGILIFRDQDVAYDIAPRVHITHPLVFTRPVAGGRQDFDYDENYIGFAYEGVGSINRERYNYRYTLQGYDDEWINTNDLSVSFPKLAPGHYRFRVQVSLNPAFEHPHEDSYEFTIATPYWKTNIFYASCLLAALLIGYAYIRIRERGLTKIVLLQQERMMFEYEHLKSQVNPHFLFNSLNALSILIEEKRENASAYAMNLADLYRNMLTHGKNDVITLKEEVKILYDYVQIQQTRFGEAFRVHIEIPAEVLDTGKIIPLALQILVENAIKHNVVSAASPLVVYIEVKGDEVIVRNIINAKLSREKGAGIGLVNIRQRYALLTRKAVSYGVSGNEYIVKLPLL
jgi:ligand-binding sensor domain-containing protein